MSLYIGKDYNHDAIMAISSDVRSSSYLSSDFTDFSTIHFHSKMPFMTCDYSEYINPAASTTNTPTSGDGTAWKIFEISKAAEYMVDSSTGVYRTLFVFINDVYIPLSLTEFQAEHYYLNDDYFRYSSTDECLYIASTESSVNTIKIIFTNFFGVELLEEGTTNKNSIELSNSSIKIGGEELFTKQWLTYPSINNTDTIVTILGKQYQIINSIQPEGSVSISTEDGVKIALGDKLVVDSSHSSAHPLTPNTKVLVTTETKAIHITTNSNTQTEEFDAFIPYSDNVLLISAVAEDGSFIFSPVLLSTLNDSDYIKFYPIFVPGETNNGVCNGFIAIRLTNNKLELAVSIEACFGDTSGPTDFVIDGDIKLVYRYLDK